MHYFYTNRKSLLSFLRYLFIGGLVFVIDFGMFRLLLLNQVYRPSAVTIAYLVGVCSHFILNRFFNFRNFERSIGSQLRTYLIVALGCWFVTIIVIEASVRGVGLSPLAAKVFAIAINIPIGFLGHRYLTFGSGIRGTLRRWRK